MPYITPQMILDTAISEYEYFKAGDRTAATYQNFAGIGNNNWCSSFVSYVFHNTKGGKYIYPTKKPTIYRAREIYEFYENNPNLGRAVDIKVSQKQSQSGLVKTSNYSPQPGDIVFFKHSWNGTSLNHIGIVYNLL